MSERIYLDHAAATPLRPEVKEVMDQVEGTAWANASSLHQEGRDARKIIDDARKSVADFFGVDTTEVIFTSGATESNVSVLRGVTESKRAKGEKVHIVINRLEHASIMESVEQLEKMGVEVTWLSVDEQGRVNAEELKAALKPETVLVSIIFANNEMGFINDIAALSRIVKKNNTNTLFHTDAAQAVGWVDFKINELGVDLLTASSYKIGGPKGVGLLVKRENVKITPLFPGSQEWEKRGGTEPTSLIAGFAKALELTSSWPKSRVKDLRDSLIQKVTTKIPSVICNTIVDSAVPHIAHFSFADVESDVLTLGLDREGLAVSPGSACSSGALQISHVVEGMKIDTKKYPGQLRLSLGVGTSEEEVKRAVEILIQVVADLRSRS